MLERGESVMKRSTVGSHTIRHATLIAVGLFTAATTPALAQTRPSIAALQAQIATLEAGTIPNAAGYVTMDLSNPARPTLRVAGANLQVVNGLGGTESENGLGNVIVGYDELRGPAQTPPVCSQGQQDNPADCAAFGGIWAVNHKSGSHNVVVGREHNYSSHGGLVAGAENTINGYQTSILGGWRNTASASYSTVMGGYLNRASGAWASVSGGQGNTASGGYSSVSGGAQNSATGDASSVSGGFENFASALGSSISGGSANLALGQTSSVSGGTSRTASDIDDWVAGALFEDQ
jgi:hypothetical protein